MYRSTNSFRVRYGETDKMGYVYHGNYAQYFELGREEAMRNLGSDYATLERSGVLMPVISLWTKFFAPAYYDQELTVTTEIKTMPNIRMKFDYHIHDKDEMLIASGQTVLVFVGADTRKPVKPPEWFLDLLRPYFKSS